MRPVLRRALVALVILAIHWVGFRFLLIAPGLLPRDAEDPFVTTVYFLADPLREPAVQPDARNVAKSQPTAPISESETQTSEPQVSEAPRAIDWALEAEAAARRQLANDEETRRLANSFGHEFKDSTPDPNPAKDFAWSRAHTQRIEPLEGGGTLIRLNERCSLVFVGILIPVCQMGKIETRGDLFDGMKDPPVLGIKPQDVLP